MSSRSHQHPGRLVARARRIHPALTSIVSVLALGALVVTATPALATPSNAPSDGRATFVSGNADNCAQAGITAQHMLYANGDADNSDANVSGDVSAYTGQNPPGATPYASDADMLNVTLLNASVVVKGVVVKGGNAYNQYATNVANMISPFNNGGNVPNISHWFVCYDLQTPQTGGLDLSLIHI